MASMDDLSRRWTVRHGEGTDLETANRIMCGTMLNTVDPRIRFEHKRPLYRELGHENALYATDDHGEIVGTAHRFRLRMTLPGGLRAVAGVTGVGVWPTHRRQGVLGSLMRRQLTEIHEAGGRYAALWASEGAIYGRFGYGPACTEMEISLRRPHTVLRADAPRDPDLRIVLSDPAPIRADLARVHDRFAAGRNGVFQRSDDWWEWVLQDPQGPGRGGGPLMAALVHGADSPLGFALYRTHHGRVEVQEIVATAPAAWTALLEHLFHRDLTTGVYFEFLPLDSPVLELLVDRGRAAPVLYPSVWLRLVDVPGALAERSYTGPFTGVIEVADRYAPWNAGRWRVEADTEGARVEATEAAPDLSLDVAHLGAGYLGQVPLTRSSNAGLVTEYTQGAVARLDTALHRPDAPFGGLIF